MFYPSSIIAFVAAFQIRLCFGTVNLLLPIPETEKLLGKVSTPPYHEVEDIIIERLKYFQVCPENFFTLETVW